MILNTILKYVIDPFKQCNFAINSFPRETIETDSEIQVFYAVEKVNLVIFPICGAVGQSNKS